MIFDALSLEAAEFSPYGEVFRVMRSPQGRTETSWFPESADHDRPMNVAYSVKAAAPFPLSIRQLERHTLSSQLFVPIDLSRYLVVACNSAANGMPDLSSIGVFMADSSQSVRYGRGVWHAALHLADRPGSYLAVRYCRSMDDDLELFELPVRFEIRVPK